MAKTLIYKSDEGKKQVLSYYETLLTQWHQPFRQITLETTFGNTFIIESGLKESPTILFLHGSGSNSAMWLADAMILSETYHVIAIDIIGECGKSSENRPEFKNGNYSGWISETIEKLALNRISIMACSLGGWIALDFSIKHPERIEKLVLMATAGITQVKLKTIFWIIITSMMGTWGFNRLNRMVYGNLTIDNKSLEFASLVKENYKPRTDVLPVLTNESLRQIKAPTLFIGGENDCFYDSRKTASRLKENMDNVKCLVLKDTGHVVINQTNNILQFLKS
jgi:pimeloyl-ACP methyl ester carboxylesterase